MVAEIIFMNVCVVKTDAMVMILKNVSPQIIYAFLCNFPLIPVWIFISWWGGGISISWRQSWSKILDFSWKWTHSILKVLIQAVTGASTKARTRSSLRCGGRSWDSLRALFFIRKREIAAASFTLTLHNFVSAFRRPDSSNILSRSSSSCWSRGRNRLL